MEWNGVFLLDHVTFLDAEIRPNKPVSGVYLLDGVYVGEAANIRRRIAAHVSQALGDWHYNKLLGKHIADKIKSGEKVQVKLLSRNRQDEYALTESLRAQGYNLLNHAHGRLKGKINAKSVY